MARLNNPDGWYRWFRRAQGRESLEMAAGRSRLFSAILIDPPSLDRRQTALEIPPSPPWNFCKSSRVRRSRENFIELISPIRWGANGSIRDKEREGVRLVVYQSSSLSIPIPRRWAGSLGFVSKRSVFKRSYVASHALTRLNNWRLIN